MLVYKYTRFILCCVHKLLKYPGNHALCQLLIVVLYANLAAILAILVVLYSIMKNQFLIVLLLTAGGFVLPVASQLGNATYRYEVKVLETPQGEVCPAAEQLERTRNEIRNETLTIIRERVLPPPAPTYECGGMSGWMRVTFINMTDPSQECPSGLALTTYSKRTCGRTTSAIHRCDSTLFSVGGMAYSRVCGRIIGYQFGNNYAFYPYLTGGTTIDSRYVDGVSLTHGAPGAREHMDVCCWSYSG